MGSWAMGREEVVKPCGLGRDSQSQLSESCHSQWFYLEWFFPVLDPQIQEGCRKLVWLKDSRMAGV